MDAELVDFLTNMTRTLQREMDGLNAQLRDVREEMRDMREEIRKVNTALRQHELHTSERIGKVTEDYREARRTRDLRAISMEARLEEVERRLTDLEGGKNGHQ